MGILRIHLKIYSPECRVRGGFVVPEVVPPITCMYDPTFYTRNRMDHKTSPALYFLLLTFWMILIECFISDR